MSTAAAVVCDFFGLCCLSVLTQTQEESSKITTQATGATSWRRADVKYKKNEAFVDVVETVNLSMSAKGTLSIHAYPVMSLTRRTRHCLKGGRGRTYPDAGISFRNTGMQIRLERKLVIDKSEHGMGDAVELDDCRFHQCVRLDEFDSNRTISFIPPDGEFELMRCG